MNTGARVFQARALFCLSGLQLEPVENPSAQRCRSGYLALAWGDAHPNFVKGLRAHLEAFQSDKEELRRLLSVSAGGDGAILSRRG